MPERKQTEKNNRLHVLKHLNILFQPVFAEAWVKEKLPGGVDTSTSIIERDLYELRNMLPFVRNPDTSALQANPVGVQHSNFALVFAELQNKAGDLYFFKGIQPRHLAVKQAWRGDGVGFLLKAHDHYALGLHELRRFVTYRATASRSKLNIFQNTATADEPTLVEAGWSDFMFRAVGSALLDIAEAALGRVSMLALVDELAGEENDPREPAFEAVTPNVREQIRKATDTVVAWLEGQQKPEIVLNLCCGEDVRLGHLDEWFGRWEPQFTVDPDQPGRFVWPEDGPVVNYDEQPSDEEHSHLQRLLFVFTLCRVGARFLERAGYLEDAGREEMQMARLTSTTLWWGGMLLKAVDKPGTPQNERRVWLKHERIGEAIKHPVWNYLIDLSLDTLDKACHLFRRSRRTAERQTPDPYRVGNELPLDLAGVACNLALGAQDARWTVARRTKLRAVLLHCVGARAYGAAQARVPPMLNGATLIRATARALLEDLVRRHAYPALVRQDLMATWLLSAATSTELPLDAANDARLGEMCDELLRVDDALQAPLHMTRFRIGHTLAMVWCRLHERNPDSQETARVCRVALRHLTESQTMVTMRRAYYENISGLSYLYDDFNDRQVHFNHAVQMAAYDLTDALRTRLKELDGDTPWPNPVASSMLKDATTVWLALQQPSPEAQTKSRMSTFKAIAELASKDEWARADTRAHLTPEDRERFLDEVAKYAKAP